MNEYNPNEQKDNVNLNASFTTKSVQETKVRSPEADRTISNYGRVFLWFGIGLLITGLVAFGLPNIFMLVNNNNKNAIGNTYITLLIISLVGIIPLSIIMAFAPIARKSKIFIKVTYILYTALMGVLLSSFMLMMLVYTEELNLSFINLIAYSFLITAGLFMISGIIGFAVKDMSPVIPILASFSTGILILCLLNIFLRVSYIYWIIDICLFVYIMLITTIDMYNVKQICSKVNFDDQRNLAVYLAYNLYTDFIIIFLRVVMFVLVLLNSSNK